MLPDVEVMFCKACWRPYCHICYPQLISYVGMFQGPSSYPWRWWSFPTWICKLTLWQCFPNLICIARISLKNSAASNFKFRLLISVSVMHQSVSITTDHDPLLDLPLTPTKRMTSDECDDEPKSSQISPAQLSSNKLARHDQIEWMQLLAFFFCIVWTLLFARRAIVETLTFFSCTVPV